MSLLKRNIIANFAGQGWTALMALAFVPLYIKFLGIEAYGLIGFFAMMQASFQILDLGLSQTMNREMARYSVLPDKSSEMRDFVRTFEFGYWAIGIAIGGLVLAASPFISQHWIKAGSIPTNTIEQTVMIMGLVAAFQWPLSFYEGGLRGLQRQVLLNALKITMSTLSGGGAVVILFLVSPTITAFFIWQIIVSAVHVILYTVFLWKSLPSSGSSPRFNLQAARNVWKFAAGMSGIAVSTIVLTQIDKIILSKLLSLEMFGYYVLAGTVCSVIPTMLVGPVFNALFPRFTSLTAPKDEAAIKLLYHQSSQFVAVIVISTAMIIALFSSDILMLWTRSPETTKMAAPLVSVLVIGMALNGLMAMPYALQLAHGWTSIGLRIILFLIVLLVPTIIYMTINHGALGAASVWVLLNTIYLLIGAPLTHRRLLKNELAFWATKDIGIPLLAAILTAGLGRLIISSPMSVSKTLVMVTLAFLATVVISGLTATHIRTWLLTKLLGSRNAHA